MPTWRTPKGPQLRYCAKLALAAIAAYALSLGGRNEYALFSVLGATLVMGTSVGEDLNTSRNRILGTLAGAVVGAAVAIHARQLDLVARHCGCGIGVVKHRAGLGCPRVARCNCYGARGVVYACRRRRAIRRLANAEHSDRRIHWRRDKPLDMADSRSP